MLQGDLNCFLQIGNLQAMAQFLSNASKSLSGTLADVLSPARMIIFGTLLTTINKPMFAMSGYVFASFGTVVCLYWVTFAKVFDRSATAASSCAPSSEDHQAKPCCMYCK